MIWVDDGTEEGIKTFTDIRTWEGGIREFLRDEQCDPKVIESIMADEKRC